MDLGEKISKRLSAFAEAMETGKPVRYFVSSTGKGEFFRYGIFDAKKKRFAAVCPCRRDAIELVRLLSKAV